MERDAQHDGNADQVAYWNGAAGQRWTERQETQDALLAPVTDVLVAKAQVAPGEHVIDIGCGCGATTIELARRVGPTGHVLGVDISVPMLGRARERVPSDLRLDFVLADVTVHAFEPERADLLFSRFGVMFFAEPARSFGNMRRALKPGARLAFACWREPRANPWMMLPLQEAYRHVPRMPEMGPDDPGPFAFASKDRVHGILSKAGFSSIVLEPIDLALDIAVGGGLEAAVEGALHMGPASRALEGQPPDLQEAAARSIRAALAPLHKNGSVLLPAAIWIVTARNG